MTPTRLTLVAPGEIPLGESVQLRANLHQADGTVQDVTGQAEWNAGHPLTVSTTGLATGQGPGRAPVSVTTRSDTQGYFEIFGVAGPAVVRASSVGYPDETQQIDMATHASLTFTLFTGGPSGEGCWDY